MALLLSRHLDERVEEDAVAPRLEALELSHKKWEAEAEALVLQAKGKFEAARSAEERTRTMKKSIERDPESGAESTEELAAAYRELLGIPAADGEGGEEGGVLALPEGMEADGEVRPDRTAALRMKFR